MALSESKQGQEEAEEVGSGRGSGPLPSQDGASGRELGRSSSVQGCALSTGMTQHLHTSYWIGSLEEERLQPDRRIQRDSSCRCNKYRVA